MAELTDRLEEAMKLLRKADRFTTDHLTDKQKYEADMQEAWSGARYVRSSFVETEKDELRRQAMKLIRAVLKEMKNETTVRRPGNRQARTGTPQND